MEWYWNLVSLMLDENRPTKSTVGLQEQLKKRLIKLYQELLHYQMKSVLVYHRDRAPATLRDLVKLDDWQEQLQDVKKAEEIVKRDLEQFSTEQFKLYLRDIIESANSQLTQLLKINSAIQDQTRQQAKEHQNDKDEECKRYIFETDPSDDRRRIQETKGGLLRDSYCWILKHADFRRFQEEAQSRVLWIKGDPGKGKTMLLCGIIDELEKMGQRDTLTYFLCQATVPRLNNATSVLRGLVYHLVKHHPSLVSYIREEYDSKGSKLLESNALQVLSRMLSNMLNDPTLRGAIILIDGLDECTADRPLLLKFVRDSLAPVKWIITSRNYPDIESKLDGLGDKVKLSLELNENAICDAVCAYIRHKVAELATEKRLDNMLLGEMQRYFETHADGTFLWVALVYQALSAPSVKKVTIKRQRLWEKYPKGLDALYGRMMGELKEEVDCKQILAIASVVYRPISLGELSALMEFPEDIDDDDLKELIKSCGSFLALRQGIIYFVHQSAKDYLERKAPGQIWPSGLAYQHHWIFAKSLRILSDILRRDIYNLGNLGCLIGEVETPTEDPLSSARYSCVYWVDHLVESHSGQPAEFADSARGAEALRGGHSVDKFIKEKYLNWLEALSLCKSIPEGILALNKLETLVVSYTCIHNTE